MEFDRINELKKTVWVIYVGNENNDGSQSRTTGVCIGTNRILTCAHGIDSSDTVIYGRRWHDEHFRKLETVYVRPTWDLRLLKAKDGYVAEFETAPISHNERLAVDQLLFHIGHPSGLGYTFLAGKVAYPCVQVPSATFLDDSLICWEHHHDFNSSMGYSTMGCIHNKLTFAERELPPSELCKHLHPMVPIIKTTCMGDSPGCSGGPIFRANGEVVGIVSQEFKGLSVAIHASAFKALIQEADAEQQKADPKRFYESTSLPDFDASQFVEIIQQSPDRRSCLDV